MLHLIALDAAQHTYGPGSPEALEALARIDGYVGELVDAARKAPGGDQTTVAIVSDHGFLPLHDAAATERRAEGGRPDRRRRDGRRHRLARLEPLGRRLGLRLREGRGRSPARGRRCSRR